jgi:hypothetical protein
MYKVVFTHKKCSIPDGYIKIDNRKSDLDHRVFSELAGMKLLYNTVEEWEKDLMEKKIQDMPDFISMNHYRRYFDKDCHNRIFVPQPLMFNCSLAQNYDACHNIIDLQECAKAVSETFPAMVQSFNNAMNSNLLIPYIIAIMPVNVFKEYWNFLYTVLMKYCDNINCHTYEEFKERVTKTEGYNKDINGRNNDIEYQCRIPSFLAERLATCYLKELATKIPVFPAQIVLTEKDQKI